MIIFTRNIQKITTIKTNNTELKQTNITSNVQNIIKNANFLWCKFLIQNLLSYNTFKKTVYDFHISLLLVRIAVYGCNPSAEKYDCSFKFKC